MNFRGQIIRCLLVSHRLRNHSSFIIIPIVDTWQLRTTTRDYSRKELIIKTTISSLVALTWHHSLTMFRLFRQPFWAQHYPQQVILFEFTGPQIQAVQLWWLGQIWRAFSNKRWISQDFWKTTVIKKNLRKIMQLWLQLCDLPRRIHWWIGWMKMCWLRFQKSKSSLHRMIKS